MKVVAVYSPSDEHIFRKTDSEIVDSQLDIHLSTQTLFAKRL
jgi:hypothetical protein